MHNKLTAIFGRDKYIIAGVHLLALPGTPGYDSAGGMSKIIDSALIDALKLEEGGVDGIIFTNEADTPYELRVGAATVAAFSRCVTEVVHKISLPFGINLLLDPVAGIAVAHATGASFVRGYFTGSYVGDISFMDSRGAEALRFRRNIGAEKVALISNLTCGFGMNLDTRNLSAIAHGAIFHGRVDALSVSGLAAGCEADQTVISEARNGSEGVPVLVGTGTNKKNIASYLGITDGAIVATALKEDGKTLNPIDSQRVQDFMSEVNCFREAQKK